MKSKIKITSFLLVLIINFLVGILFWTIFIKAGNRIFEYGFWTYKPFILFLIIFLEIFALSLVFQLKRVIIEKDKVIFKNLIFPFLKTERLFTYYDFSKIVERYSKSGYHESLWLFKNGKLENQISSFYYSNYTKLKFEMKVQHKGKLKINSFKQIYYKLGGKL
ncbi:antitoxin component YwqK of YwqJK toxin-antitoxin module [Flavobacterium sp. 28A]|uniref:hypothetical protein n=1 Tax=Flavobacterium sp. 28A TaxID=2735895 RepID=UPI00156EE8C7|nr:hypothetical protein [Flavobacterium sp. 28A]NRT14662.1 antitoxin component YwqK of YwqJK toxin-antitoxin module [Flavobacterium sp. 28A]